MHHSYLMVLTCNIILYSYKNVLQKWSPRLIQMHAWLSPPDNRTTINHNHFSAHTFFCIVAALHYFRFRHHTDKIVGCAGECCVSVLHLDDILQPGPTYGLVPHGPVVGDTAASGCTAFQQNCTGLVQVVPGGIAIEDRLLCYRL